jgi:hypothetical protein
MNAIASFNATMSAKRLYVTLGISIFVGEILIMIFLSLLPPLSRWAENLLDSTFLVILTIPVLHFATLRPLMNRINEKRQVEESLCKERNLLTALMDNIPDHIYFKDNESRFLSVSKSQAAVFGLDDPSKVIGKTDFDFFSEEHALPAFEDERTIMKSGHAIFDVEEKESWPDGRETWVSTTKAPLLDEQGNIMGTFGISRDITVRKRIEEALTYERNLLKALMDNIPDRVYYKDTESRFLRISRSQAKLFGLDDPAQAIGKTDFDFFAKEHARPAFEDEQTIIKSGNAIVDVEEKESWPDGRETWVSTTKMPLHNAQGQIIGTFGISRDTTERKRAEEALKQRENEFREMFDDAPVGYHEFDAEGRIKHINRTEFEMLGYSKTEMVGTYVWEFSAEREVSHQAILAKLAGTKPPSKSAQQSYCRKDGTTFSALIEDRILRNSIGEITGIRTIMQDMTELMQAQDKIRKQMSVIEETNIQLSQARDQAMQASKTKSSFLASMSHELRTPLNAIIGYSEILLEEMHDVGESGYTNDIEKIRTAGNNLLALINDILDLSKIEAGRMDLFIEEFDLQLLLKEIDSTINPLVTKKANTLTVTASGPPLLLRLDHTKLRQILFNLLSNSCKFTEHGKITLTVESDSSHAKFDHDVVMFSVRDSGIGMTQDQMKKLFKDFSQADGSTTKKFGGTGLGLAITKKFCEMMNGSITVQSVPNEGTTFTVTLPTHLQGNDATHDLPARGQTALSSSAPSVGPTVLIIDDDNNVRELLTRMLMKDGYSPVTAGNGVEGLALARKVLPMVVILDVMMPYKDGWAVLREMKEDPTLKSIPVIMHTIIDNRNLGFAIGAQDYLVKPVDHEKLISTIRRYDDQRRSMNILIVDDEPDQRDILSRILLKEGWNVQTADGGLSALSLLARSAPDIITLDLMMPTMDGFEFLKLVKENTQWSHIPIIILTSMDLDKAHYEKLTGSVATVLRKSDFDPQQLLDLVRRYTQPISPEIAHEQGANA